MTLTLWGMVQLKPWKPITLAPSTAASKVVRANFNSEITPVEIVVLIGSLDHDLRGIFGNRLSESGGEFLLEV